MTQPIGQLRTIAALSYAFVGDNRKLGVAKQAITKQALQAIRFDLS